MSRAHLRSWVRVSMRIIALPYVPRPRPLPWPRSFNHATARQSIRARASFHHRPHRLWRFHFPEPPFPWYLPVARTYCRRALVCVTCQSHRIGKASEREQATHPSIDPTKAELHVALAAVACWGVISVHETKRTRRASSPRNVSAQLCQRVPCSQHSARRLSALSEPSLAGALGQWPLAAAEREVKSFVSVTYGYPQAASAQLGSLDGRLQRRPPNLRLARSFGCATLE